MSGTVNVNVHHITRVEGHGNIVLDAKNGTIEKLEWQVPEAPRFFEAMVRGRSWQDIQTITSRICGICSFTHSLAATKAVEDAMGITISEQTDRLRMLGMYAEQLQSHILHVGYLVAPDLLGVNSVVPLVASHPAEVKTIIRLHRLGNTWQNLIGGRQTHPTTFKPGEMARIPSEAELKSLKADLEAAVPDLKAVGALVLSLAGNLPDFQRPTEYISLSEPDHYSFYHGPIASTDTDEKVPVQEWERVANEYVHPQSTAKWAKWHRESYAVGALARFNNQAQFLNPLAKETAKAFGLEKGCCNPFFNNVAQVVEAVHVVEEGIALIDTLLSAGLKDERANVTPRAGKGTGGVEAPRGLLLHSYEFDENGNCTWANLCIPTNQNHANIQKDFEALVPQILDKEQSEITLLLEMLVRSYDPCISCSTHFLNVEFV
jgi:coenzyme F420-reducing hydrogenase alpha subunit